MSKSSGVILILALIIIGFVIFIWGNSANKNKSASANDNSSQSSQTTETGGLLVSGDISMDGAVLTIYYGSSCPHCADLEEWLQKNGYLPEGKTIDQTVVNDWIKNSKVKFNMKEIYSNNKNNAELLQNAEKAGIDSSNVGVPFLYDSKNNKSYIGGDEIQKFFNSM